MRWRITKGELAISIGLIIMIATPFWLPCMFFAVDRFYFTPARNIEMDWDVQIPPDFEQVYHVDSDSIYARGDRYTVYETPEKIADFVDGFSLIKENGVESLTKETMRALSVPEKERPSFHEDSCYYFQKAFRGDRLLIIYSPVTSRCFFIESFCLDWDGYHFYGSKRY